MIKKFLFWGGLAVIFYAVYFIYHFAKEYISPGKQKVLVVNIVKVRENHPFLPIMHSLFQKMQALNMVNNYRKNINVSTMNTSLQKVKSVYLQGIQEDYHQEVKDLMNDLQEKEKLLIAQKEKEIKLMVDVKRKELEDELNKQLQDNKKEIKKEKVKKRNKIKEKYVDEKFKLDLKIKTLGSLTEEEKNQLKKQIENIEEKIKDETMKNEQEYEKKYSEIVSAKQKELEDNLKQYQGEATKKAQQEIDEKMKEIEKELETKVMAKKASLQNAGKEVESYLKSIAKLKFPATNNLNKNESLKKVMTKLNNEIMTIRKVIIDESNKITISVAREKGNTVLLNSYIVNVGAEDITKEAIKKVKKLN